MVKAGYDQNTAELGVWSALWLHSRYCDGVTLLVTFLIQTRHLPREARLPHRHSEYGIAGKCPFYLGTFVRDKWEKMPNRDVLAVGAPAAPILMMPLMAELAWQFGKGVKMEHRSYDCVVSRRGFANEKGFGQYFFIDENDDGPVLMSRLRGSTEFRGRRIFTELNLPANRLSPDDTLDLSTT